MKNRRPEKLDKFFIEKKLRIKHLSLCPSFRRQENKIASENEEFSWAVLF